MVSFYATLLILCLVSLPVFVKIEETVSRAAGDYLLDQAVACSPNWRLQKYLRMQSAVLAVRYV